MIEILTDVPGNVAGFRAVGEVTKDDFQTTVLPKVDEVVISTGELNYLMIIDTPLSNWTYGAWVQDALLGIQEITKWNRAAIVTDSEALNQFTDIFSILVPGTFRGFLPEQLPEAVEWVATGKKAI
ncbi:SpoIIAA-like [Filimonas lacunae]|uniref:SpoIIAA-like n=1 Tax=Filimonas lacunae TaxID=477680 RepID=A0A173MFL3_9BACT|nr:STAS/SEC14 domain-containing protein [Filimonas lacunae]BAV06228.1 hypothetical protein FLA_2244 [Filimonas lacunae]SIT25362.1 SpoIIAA-like [Filimonas lacunae]